jgi:copper chaperone
MVSFQVDDMTCGHCASAISRAIAAVDEDARLDIRIQQKLVLITSTASATDLAEAIQDAGYTPQAVSVKPSEPAPSSLGGCGCGCDSQKTSPVGARQEATSGRSQCCG